MKFTRYLGLSLKGCVHEEGGEGFIKLKLFSSKESNRMNFFRWNLIHNILKKLNLGKILNNTYRYIYLCLIVFWQREEKSTC